MSVATTVLDVSNACLEKALESVGAEAGFVVLTGPAGTRTVEIVTSSGYDDDVLGDWRALDLDSDVPFARAIASGEPVWALSDEEMSAFTGVREARAAGWVSLPLHGASGRPWSASSLLPFSAIVHRGRPRVAPVDGLAVRPGARARKSVRGRADDRGDPPAQRPAELAASGRGRELAARYLPGSAELDVGGDWFDVLQLPDGKLGLVVGDVVGKGVQAAASMAQLRNAIRAFSVDRLKPSSVLVRLNRLADEVLDTSFATLAYLAIDPETGVCRLSSAGHPPPVVAYPDGRVELIESARGLPLGTGLRTTYRQQTLELPAGASSSSTRTGSSSVAADRSTTACRNSRTRSRRRRRTRTDSSSTSSSTSSATTSAETTSHSSRPACCPSRRGRSSFGSRPTSARWSSCAMRCARGCDGVELERTEVEDVVLATWEACANAIEHAVEPAERVVVVRAALDDSLIRVTVGDTGQWAPPTEREDRGLGLRLMEALVSSVDVAESPDGHDGDAREDAAAQARARSTRAARSAAR